ncbi:hypothetical protein [Massilia violaceinigra]|uniref:hypothetical protein n=1 Tax=Massilia violaceinigra TaxID=2045208 RepID=UPI0012FD669C|nr:hypothetical protein [Massilia violaceinigra]
MEAPHAYLSIQLQEHPLNFSRRRSKQRRAYGLVMPSNADKRPSPFDFLEAPGLRRAARREFTFDAAPVRRHAFLRFDFFANSSLWLSTPSLRPISMICFSMAARTSPSPGADAPIPRAFQHSAHGLPHRRFLPRVSARSSVRGNQSKNRNPSVVAMQHFDDIASKEEPDMTKCITICQQSMVAKDRA